MNVVVKLLICWACPACGYLSTVEMYPGFFCARYPCRCGLEYTIATHDVDVRVSLYDYNKKEVQ